MSASALLDPALVRELDGMREDIRARGTGVHGYRPTHRKGSSAEFREHRSYSAGDDLRHIDWFAFARTGEPVIKCFKNEEDAIVRVILDCSASLTMGGPRKIDRAKTVAASIAYLTLSQTDRFSVIAAGDDVFSTGPFRGRSSLGAIIRAIDAVVPRGTTDLVMAIDTTLRGAHRPGALIILSDFLDPGAVDRALERATAAGHDITLVQVLTEEEVRPPFTGEVTLEDAETGECLSVTLDATTVAAYRARLEALFDNLRRVARRHRGSYVQMLPSHSVGGVLRRLLARGID